MPTKREEREAKQRRKAAERELCLQFIEEYRLREPLWNMLLPDYHNRTVRNQLTEELLMVAFQLWQPEATKTEMMSKLNTLKTTYRTERKKVVSSEKSGTGVDDLYNPTWYCYSALDAFMREASGAEPANDHVSSMDVNVDVPDNTHVHVILFSPSHTRASNFIYNDIQ